MPLFPRLFRLLAALVILLPGVAVAAPDLLGYLENLPLTNPYREPLLKLERLSPEDRAGIEAWVQNPVDADPFASSPLTEAQRAVVDDLKTSVLAAGSRPVLDAVEWPSTPDPDDPDNPAASSFPGVGPLRQLSRIVVRAADGLPAERAVDAYAAVAQIGRQQRAGETLIEQLTGVAIEGISLSAAARRLGELPPDGLRRLSTAWHGLHPAPSNAQAMAGERDHFFQPIVENVIRPGLHALLAEELESAGQSPITEESPGRDAESFTRNLRLSALVNLGGGEHQISLESISTQTTFALREGETVEGIELLSLDFDQKLAVIRRGEREAVIHLESKRIVERRREAGRLREMFAGFDLLNGEGAGKTALAALLKRAREHPAGVDGYVDELFARYQRTIDEQLAAAESPKAIAPPEATLADDPLVSFTAPTIGRVARALNNVSTQSTMLQAAIHHRLQALGQANAPAPVDPWAENREGFSLEASPDGGFTLRSRYEVNPDQPLTYKFAAPDAGFVRPK